jgi:hypothetical protein
MVVTCLLLAISGGIRFWRDRQFRTLAEAGAIAPFPMDDLPKNLGTWRCVEGSQTQLEPEVARTAGSSDHIIREYVDEKSGEHASAVILYGLASIVFAHTPDVCYPGHGYRPVVEPEDRQLSVPGLTTPVRCRRAIYSKKLGGIERYEVVYYTFLHNGQWVTDIANRWKSFRYHPGVFKIQLQRTVSSMAPQDSASESLLSQIVQAISARISPDKTRGASQDRPATVATQVQSDRKPG